MKLKYAGLLKQCCLAVIHLTSGEVNSTLSGLSVDLPQQTHLSSVFAEPPITAPFLLKSNQAERL